jgi:hypothetical protein
MSVAWVAVGASVIGTAASVSGAKKAGQQQADATQAATDATLTSEREAREAQQPFLNAGYAGVNRLQELLGIGGNAGAAGYGSLNTPFSFKQTDLAADPSYQFQLAQGQNALDRKQAAGGGFYSGAGLQAASAFNQNLAGTTFNDAYNRQFNEFQTNRANTLNPLQSLAGQGQTSANNVSGIAQNTGNSLASLISSNGNAQGASTIAQGNSLASGLNGGLAAYQRAGLFSQQQATPNAYAGYGGDYNSLAYRP